MEHITLNNGVKMPMLGLGTWDLRGLLDNMGTTISSSKPSDIDEPASQPSDSDTKSDAKAKILVAYFSCTGTTEKLAAYAADALGADLYEIVPETSYTEADLNYSNSSSRATREQNDTAVRPVIFGSVSNMEQYDIVFLGYPIWWGQAPRITSLDLGVEAK